MLNIIFIFTGFADKIIAIDRWLFLKINDSWANPFFDTIFPLWRHSDFWIPLYFFLALLMLMNFGWRSFFWMLFIGLVAGIGDQISSSIIKDLFDRVRPCSEPLLTGKLHLLLNRCPTSGSFTSSHATNHFAIAMFIYCTAKDVFRSYTKLFFVWAATICYGQVYVGVHYPLDVVGGAVLGCAIGYGVALIFNAQPALSFHKKTLVTTQD